MDVKKWIIRLFLAFAVFYVLTRPDSAAGAVSGAFDGVVTGAGQLAEFVSHITF